MTNKNQPQESNKSADLERIAKIMDCYPQYLVELPDVSHYRRRPPTEKPNETKRIWVIVKGLEHQWVEGWYNKFLKKWKNKTDECPFCDDDEVLWWAYIYWPREETLNP